ncbi:MAG: NAD-dependent epimerase/dehydratase [Pseudonocardiales bacterium]|nr:NAD-dependent epimerase/dehydratase [Pseudonocardiales bacterium]
MSSVVLITGVSRHLGARLAEQLADDPAIDRVIGIDATAPRKADLERLGRTEFVRADIRNPLIAKVIAQAQVDTVVHAAALDATTGSLGGVGARVSPKDHDVVGTMQLLAACQKSDTVSRVVVKSTTAVYGSGPGDPAVFTEDMHATGHAPCGYAKGAVEVEGYVRGFMRRRPDITVTILRYASLIGPTIESPLTRYLAMPLVPTSIGFDPRLQLLHEADAVEVLRHAAVAEHPGVFNVAADGVVLLSQAVRRAGRLRLPVPAPAISFVGGLVRNSGVVEFSAEQASFLNYGRVVDTARLREGFGYLPRFSTQQALASYLDALPGLRGLPGLPGLGAGALRAVESLAGRLARVV